MSTQPIAGNESFKNVNTLAGQIPYLDASEITAFHTDSVILGGGNPLDPGAPHGEDNHLVILSGNPILMGDCCSDSTSSQISIYQGVPTSAFVGAQVQIGTGETDETDPGASKVEIRGVEVQVQGIPTGKLGFFNVTPVVKPVAGGAAATFVTNTSGIANDTGTWGGYTIGQVVQALQDLGLLT